MARILIVDDDPDSCEVLAKFLARISHTPLVAGEGGAALRSLLDYRADAIVLDLNMPEMDGFGFLQIIRSYIRLSRIPVIVVTGTNLTQPTIEELKHYDVRRIFLRSMKHWCRVAREIFVRRGRVWIGKSRSASLTGRNLNLFFLPFFEHPATQVGRADELRGAARGVGGADCSVKAGQQGF
jgi:CheY-like chemotaxis protein